MKPRIENRTQVILDSIADGVFAFTHVVMKKDQITKLRSSYIFKLNQCTFRAWPRLLSSCFPAADVHDDSYRFENTPFLKV